jgi:hypothetical protein
MRSLARELHARSLPVTLAICEVWLGFPFLVPFGQPSCCAFGSNLSWISFHLEIAFNFVFLSIADRPATGRGGAAAL